MCPLHLPAVHLIMWFPTYPSEACLLVMTGKLTSIRLDSISGEVKCHGGIESVENKECWERDADVLDIVQNTVITTLHLSAHCDLALRTHFQARKALFYMI